ncbi:MAG: mobile mystery protein B [Proteobacteria bacterium]|nr:mobile mystery protein B [Pseudomonadota bacterium]
MTIDYSDGATPFSQDEMDDLLLTHITTRGELDRWELENINEAYQWAERLKHRNILNENFLCLLHKRMFGNVWKWAGTFRKSEKNIGISWVEIAVYLKLLCDDANTWLGFDTYPPDEFAARFHHRLVYIHPFANGNGRHARLMADLILEKLFKTEPFTWGGAVLTKQGVSRAAYIKALKAADNHDYSLLLQFVRS